MENKGVGQTGKDYNQILLFGGTTEGRQAAEKLLAQGVPCTVCVATSYGEEVMKEHPLLTVHTGRMDRDEMAELMRKGDFCCAVDATHPHAQVVSREIAAACRETELPYLRLQRDLSAIDPQNIDPQDTGPQNIGPQNTDPQSTGHRTIEYQKPQDAQTGLGGKTSFSGHSENSDHSDHSETADPSEKKCIFVDSIEEAAAFFAKKTGHILVTTGSKELVRFVSALEDASRITARVLPAPESLRACSEAGLTGKQIIAMQGPFDTEMNCAMIRHTGSDWLLTKETGAAGGYPEKIEAARRCGIGAVVIRRPAEIPAEGQPDSAAGKESDPGAGSSEVPEARTGYSLEETVARAMQYAGPASGKESGSADRASRQKMEKVSGRELRDTDPASRQWTEMASGNEFRCADGTRTLCLVGAGVGSPQALTGGAREAIDSAQVLFGAKSVLDNMKTNRMIPAAKTVVPAYESGKILQYLADNPQIRTAAALYSGDSGFYSGASSMLKKLEELRNPEALPALAESLEVKVIPGISCVSWFAARAGIPWQDWKILSSHGRFCNVVGQVLRNHRCFLLLAGAEDLRRTAGLLFKAQENGVLGPLQLICGYELSRPAEEIRECAPVDLLEVTREGLYVLLIQNELYFLNPVLPGMPDVNFSRQKKVPMTSEEIRVLSLSRLRLTARPVVWDVGAGSGSVSIEAAMACPEGRVYSIECKKPALEVLAANRDRYCLSNMEIIEGTAPEVLKDLPAPTHVFLGGSGGRIEPILFEVFRKNPCTRIVVNCVTAETLADLHTALSHITVNDLDCIQVSVNRMEMLGRYHALHPINPVFIISFNGTGIGTGVQYVAASEEP